MKITTAILVGSLIGINPVLVMGTPVTIAQWTFENTPIPAGAGPYSPEVGSGSASGFHAGAAVYSSPAGNGSQHSFSSTLWAVGDYWQFRVSTIGFDDISISWDQAGSGTGPSDFVLQYRTDGTSFKQVGTDYTVSLAGWSTTTYHNTFTFSPGLSSIAPLIANQQDVYFRLVDNSTTAINGNTVGTAGTDRVDNFIVSGNKIPASVPDSIPCLAGLGCVLGILTLWRRIINPSSPLPQGQA